MVVKETSAYPPLGKIFLSLLRLPSVITKDKSAVFFLVVLGYPLFLLLFKEITAVSFSKIYHTLEENTCGINTFV